MSDAARVRLLFVDEGSYHHEEITVPRGVMDQYDRLIDCICEDPLVLKRTYVDIERLCSATLVDESV